MLYVELVLGWIWIWMVVPTLPMAISKVWMGYYVTWLLPLGAHMWLMLIILLIYFKCLEEVIAFSFELWFVYLLIWNTGLYITLLIEKRISVVVIVVVPYTSSMSYIFYIHFKLIIIMPSCLCPLSLAD